MDLGKIISRFLKNPSVDNEIALHRFLSDELDICPLTNAHHHLIDGYFTYTLRHCTRTIAEVSDCINKLNHCINEQDRGGIRASLDGYFEMLAKAVIKDGDYD